MRTVHDSLPCRAVVYMTKTVLAYQTLHNIPLCSGFAENGQRWVWGVILFKKKKKIIYLVPELAEDGRGRSACAKKVVFCLAQLEWTDTR